MHSDCRGTGSSFVWIWLWILWLNCRGSDGLLISCGTLLCPLHQNAHPSWPDGPSSVFAKTVTMMGKEGKTQTVSFSLGDSFLCFIIASCRKPLKYHIHVGYLHTVHKDLGLERNVNPESREHLVLNVCFDTELCQGLVLHSNIVTYKRRDVKTVNLFP